MLKLSRSASRLEPSLIRKIFAAAPSGAINLGLGMPDTNVPSVCIEAGKEALDTKRAPYSPNAGLLSLREEIAKSYNDRGVLRPFALGVDNVIVTVGVQQGLFVALSSLCEAGDSIAVPNPGFPAYEMIAELLNLRVQYYDVSQASGFRVSMTSIEKAIDGSTKVVVLNSPSNPTGAVASETDLAEIAAGLSLKGVAYISDEIYEHFSHDEPAISIGNFSSEGIVLSGLSKSASMMGWRIGWMVVPKANASAITAVHQRVCSCANTLTQSASIPIVSAIATGASGLSKNWQLFKRRRDVSVALLKSLNISHAPAQGGFYLWLDLRGRIENDDDYAFAMKLLGKGVIVIPGSGFGTAGAGWVRVAYTDGRFEEGLKILATALS